MMTLLFIGCSIALTVAHDFLGWAATVPEGYEDERGFHFGPEPLVRREG